MNVEVVDVPSQSCFIYIYARTDDFVQGQQFVWCVCVCVCVCGMCRACGVAYSSPSHSRLFNVACNIEKAGVVWGRGYVVCMSVCVCVCVVYM